MPRQPRAEARRPPPDVQSGEHRQAARWAEHKPAVLDSLVASASSSRRPAR